MSDQGDRVPSNVPTQLKDSSRSSSCIRINQNSSKSKIDDETPEAAISQVIEAGGMQPPLQKMQTHGGLLQTLKTKLMNPPLMKSKSTIKIGIGKGTPEPAKSAGQAGSARGESETSKRVEYTQARSHIQKKGSRTSWFNRTHLSYKSSYESLPNESSQRSDLNVSSAKRLVHHTGFDKRKADRADFDLPEKATRINTQQDYSLRRIFSQVSKNIENFEVSSERPTPNSPRHAVSPFVKPQTLFLKKEGAESEEIALTLNKETAFFIPALKVTCLCLRLISSIDYAYNSAFPTSSFIWRDAIYTTVFFLKILLTAFRFEKSSLKCIRSLKEGELVIDILSTIPLPWMMPSIEIEVSYRLHLLKVLRVLKLLSVDYRAMFQAAGFDYWKRTNKRMKKSVEVGGWMILFLAASFVFGMGWHIWSTDFQSDSGDHFFQYFNLEEHPSVSSIYFSATNLSTVGLGDLHPVSSAERVGAVLMSMAGLMLVATMASKLNHSLLSKAGGGRQTEFLGVLTSLNYGEPLPAPIVAEFKEFIQNQAPPPPSLLQLPAPLRMKLYKQYFYRELVDDHSELFDITLPQRKRRNALLKIAGISQEQATISFFARVVLDGQDEHELFVLKLLEGLEPMRVEAKSTLLRQASEPGEIYFIAQGEIEVGFNQKTHLMQKLFLEVRDPKEGQQEAEVQQQIAENIQKSLSIQNKHTPKHVFPLTHTRGLAIGLFEGIFQVKSQYLYRTKDQADLLFLRRAKWKALARHLEEWASTAAGYKFKDLILLQYVEKVYFPLKMIKEKQGDKLFHHTSPVSGLGHYPTGDLSSSGDTAKQRRYSMISSASYFSAGATPQMCLRIRSRESLLRMILAQALEPLHFPRRQLSQTIPKGKKKASAVHPSQPKREIEANLESILALITSFFSRIEDLVLQTDEEREDLHEQLQAIKDERDRIVSQQEQDLIQAQAEALEKFTTMQVRWQKERDRNMMVMQKYKKLEKEVSALKMEKTKFLNDLQKMKNELTHQKSLTAQSLNAQQSLKKVATRTDSSPNMNKRRESALPFNNLVDVSTEDKAVQVNMMSSVMTQSSIKLHPHRQRNSMLSDSLSDISEHMKEGDDEDSSTGGDSPAGKALRHQTMALQKELKGVEAKADYMDFYVMRNKSQTIVDPTKKISFAKVSNKTRVTYREKSLSKIAAGFTSHKQSAPSSQSISGMPSQSSINSFEIDSQAMAPVIPRAKGSQKELTPFFGGDDGSNFVGFKHQGSQVPKLRNMISVGNDGSPKLGRGCSWDFNYDAIVDQVSPEQKYEQEQTIPEEISAHNLELNEEILQNMAFDSSKTACDDAGSIQEEIDIHNSMDSTDMRLRSMETSRKLRNRFMLTKKITWNNSSQSNIPSQVEESIGEEIEAQSTFKSGQDFMVLNHQFSNTFMRH